MKPESNVLVVDPKGLERKKKIFSEQGKEKIHILTDFDRTLTKAYVNGRSVPSVIFLLRDKNYINKNYSEKAKALFVKYHAIEKNLSIPIKEKKRKMHEWWTKHFKLLIKSGLNKKHLEKIVQSGEIQFRNGALEFINILHKNNIPLVIMSSSGVGDVLPMLFKRENKLYKNIHFVTNLYKWDKKGNAVEIKKPIIHILNKDETAIQDYPVFSLIKNRKNVLLLGDSIDDIGMIEGFDYKNLIKIGFLNDDIEKNLKVYRKKFDIIITNDSDMNYINKLMKEIIK